MDPESHAHVWPTGDSYSQWLRRSIARVRSDASGQPLHRLFDSSTAEPTDLIAQLAVRAFSSPVTPRYQSVFAGGNQDLLDLLAQRYKIARDQILCTAGATSALSLIYRAYLSPGDHVLIESPGFDLFDDLAASQGAIVDRFERDGDNAVIDFDRLAAAVTPKTRLIVLSNLHNPTGAALDDPTLTTLAGFAEARGIDLVVDEVYREYAAAPETSAVHLSPAIVTVNSLTKVYGLSALRCGWITAHPSRMAKLRTVHTRLEFSSAKVTHALAALVLEDSSAFERHWRTLLAEAQPVIDRHLAAWDRNGLAKLAIRPDGCVCFPKLVGIDDCKRFSDWLADRYHVLVAPGVYFGKPGHIRIGFSQAPEPLDHALTLLGEGLEEYRGVRPVTAVA